MSAALSPALVIAESLKLRLIVSAEAVPLARSMVRRIAPARARDMRVSSESNSQKVFPDFIFLFLVSIELGF
jgi:hypothetical protein